MRCRGHRIPRPVPARLSRRTLSAPAPPARTVGIDLSGLSRGTKGQTALAEIAIEPSARQRDTRLFAREEAEADANIVAWVIARRPAAVAIDAPLSLPHRATCPIDPCQRCDAPDASCLARDVDRIVCGMSTVMLAAIAFRGMWLAKVLRRKGVHVVETYPAQVLAGFGLTTRGERRDPFWWTVSLPAGLRDIKQIRWTSGTRYARRSLRGRPPWATGTKWRAPTGRSGLWRSLTQHLTRATRGSGAFLDGVPGRQGCALVLLREPRREAQAGEQDELRGRLRQSDVEDDEVATSPRPTWSHGVTTRVRRSAPPRPGQPNAHRR